MVAADLLFMKQRSRTARCDGRQPMYQEPATHQALPAPLLFAVTPTQGDGLQAVDRPLCLAHTHTQYMYSFCIAFQGLFHSIVQSMWA